MDSVHDILTDEQVQLAINRVEQSIGIASFQNRNPRKLIAEAILRFACGYGPNRGSRELCFELGLASQDWQLTPLGKSYLFAAYYGVDIA